MAVKTPIGSTTQFSDLPGLLNNYMTKEQQVREVQHELREAKLELVRFAIDQGLLDALQVSVSRLRSYARSPK